MKKLIFFLLALLSIVKANSFHTSSLSNGLVAVWHFDEGQGTIVNNSVASNLWASSGTLVTPAWITGRDHYALSFNGTSDYIGGLTNAAFSPANNAVSYFITFKIPTNDTVARIAFVKVMHSTFEFKFTVDNGSGKPDMNVYNSDDSLSTTLTANTSVDDNKIHDVCFQMEKAANGAKMYIWIDGVLDAATTQGNFTVTNQIYSMQIGGNPTSIGGGYNQFCPYKLLEDCCVYSRLVSPAEIAYHHWNSRGFTNQ